MRNWLPLLVFSLLEFSFLKNLAQEAPPVFDAQYSLGGSSYDAATKIIHSNDGGYILCGMTNSTDGDVGSNNHGNTDVWIVKLDQFGSKQWKYTLGGSNADLAASIVQFPSGKIFVAANTNSSDKNVTYNHGLTDVWIVALNENGTIYWQKTFGGPGVDMAHALIKTGDNNLLVGGSSDSKTGDVTGNHGVDDYWLLKIDTLGNMMWQKSLGGSGSDICYGLAEANDGGIVAAGSSNSADGDVTGNHGALDFWVAKTNNVGILQWQKSLGGSLNESALDVIKNTDGNFVIGGYTNSNNGNVTDNKGSSDYWMVMMDTAGNMLRQNTYGGSNPDVAYSVLQANDGGYLLAGGSLSNDWDVLGNHGSEDYWLMKTDPLGTLVWSKTYGGSISDRAMSVLQMNEGGFMMAGYSYSNDKDVIGNHGNADLWVARLSCLTPAPLFTFADDTVCINSLIGFTNASSNSSVYTWLADGVPFNYNTDATFQFNSIKNYQISLVGATCYSKDTSSHIFTVIDHPVPPVISEKPYLCDGETITLSTTNADSYLWSTKDTTQSIQISAGGHYSVIISKHQCSGTSLTLDLTQYPLPPVSLNDTSFCAGGNFLLHAPAGYQNYVWQDGSTDSVFHASATGTYFVTVSSDYCSSSDSMNLTSRNCTFPVSEFVTSKNAICENTCIGFSNFSSEATSYTWSFEGADPSYSTDPSPSNVCYSIPGTYSVTLTATNSNGSVSFTRNGYIIVYGYPPVPTITANGYSLTSSQATMYQWYGNGAPVSGANMQNYTALQDGYYYVRTSNGGGCYSLSDSIYVTTTGISDFESNAFIKVSPNPANDHFIISKSEITNSSVTDKTEKRMEMTDIAGKIVIQTGIKPEELKKGINISTSNLESGVYLLRLESNDVNTFMKVVIAH